MTFIITGTFNPKDLIADKDISDWNIDQRVFIDDLTEEQTMKLVSKLGLPSNVTNLMAERLFYWTSGQPFLVQKSCYYIAENISKLKQIGAKKIVDTSIYKIISTDTNHLSIIYDLKKDRESLEEMKSLIYGKPTRLLMSSNQLHFYLTKINGIIKAESNGFCVIRNQVYERALHEAGLLKKLFEWDVFISYSHKDKKWVNEKLLVELQKAGFKTCIDSRNFKPGVPTLVNIENAIENSRNTLLVLTPNWIESNWTKFEGLLLQTGDPSSEKGRMIPIMLKACELPKRIGQLTYIDFVKPSDYEKSIEMLIRTLREADSDRK